MWVCICREINTRMVREARDHGAKVPRDVFEHFGKTVNCGKCCGEMKAILSEKSSCSLG